MGAARPFHQRRRQNRREDGEDTRSQMSFEDAKDLLRASDVTVYAIGLQRYLRASSRQRQRMFLEELTDSTGGRAYFPQEIDELDGIYEQIEAELNALKYLSRMVN